MILCPGVSKDALIWTMISKINICIIKKKWGSERVSTYLLSDMSRRSTTLTAATTTLAWSARVSCPLCIGKASRRNSSMDLWTNTELSWRHAHTLDT